jgi:ABC-type Fe3+ transport system permease subunit
MMAKKKHYQERLVKVFPSTYWMTSLTSLVGSIQALVVGVFLVRDKAEWKLHWNLELLTVVYSVPACLFGISYMNYYRVLTLNFFVMIRVYSTPASRFCCSRG